MRADDQAFMAFDVMNKTKHSKQYNTYGKYDVYQVWKSGCEYLYNHKLNML